MRCGLLRMALAAQLVASSGTLLLAQTRQATDPLPWQLYGKVRIIDGKSFEIPTMGETVRLLGYEAPELDQTAISDGIPWLAGEVARSWLVLNTLQRIVNCKPEQRDHAGRILAHCFVGNRNLALAGIEEGIGYAYSYPGEPRVPAYIDAERNARGIGLGIWSAKLEPPWEFRARHMPVARPIEPPPPESVTIPLTLPSETADPAPALPPAAIAPDRQDDTTDAKPAKQLGGDP